MEGRGREGVQLSSTNPTKPAGTLALRNFTIPRKKRVSGQVLLEPCPEESRDYSLIQSKLREARLDMRKEHTNAWLWKDVKLVHNEEFLKEFSEKRSEMRTKGRHGREMEERFCFLAASHETTTHIYQLGLRTETQEQYFLGKPSHGVYLFRHVDVALKQAATSTLSGKNLIVFKVLFGKVKKVTPSLDWKRTPDPMVAFDCHMSKDVVSHRENLSQQVLGSSVFLFDYNEIQELNKRPRQCLPYAVVSFVPAINATPPTSISPPASPVKHPTNLSHAGPVEHLRGCTVAKRRGKGENATVTFEHFATQGCPGPDYTSQTHGVNAKEVGKEKCDTEEVSTDYNAGAYADKSNPVPSASSIPSDITSDHPPVPMELKFEGLNSFLELQMMLEASQFVENKINFLSRKPTFRSLLWYDPSLYGELYKGAVGFQQQSSLFSSFQQSLGNEGYSKLQEYYTAVSTLHQQLQDAPDTSYYMYLKSKRERLEIEAALRNPPDIKSFFLSVPIALMMNFGDSLESLEKAHSIVMTFVETPSDRLPGTFDIGKAEHLSIICRYLQEKVIFMKSHEEISKVSWFGLEHLLYDASKLLVWRESEHGISNEVLRQYKRSNPQIVYGVTEAGVALVNKMEQPVETARITAQQQMEGVRNYRSIQPGMSAERTQNTLNLQTEDGVKETYQPARRRATHPPLGCNLNDSGVTPLVHPILPAQLGKPSPFTAFPQQSSAVHWKMPGTAWDWNPSGVGQTSKSHPEIRALLLSKRRATVPCAEPRTDIQNSHAVRQQQWPSPVIVNPRAVERISHQPMIGASHHPEHRKEQANDATVPLIQPYAFPTSSVVPPPLSLLPFSNTSNQVPPHEISTPINYPYFLFNGRTYSTAAPSVPLPGPALHTEARYHPHPV
ncbi:hypothetical protein AOLI_G00224040 [Acnodon oligacanthus]